jgi:hypothetical protein
MHRLGEGERAVGVEHYPYARSYRYLKYLLLFGLLPQLPSTIAITED